MPWQQQIADVGLELLPDRRPAYREVAFTVPRQSGKTTLILGVEIQRALGWAQILGMAQRIAYSAQTGKDGREKLLEDQVPLLQPHRKVLGISKVMRAFGSESITWRNGSRLGLLASSADSGHGKTLDLGIKDELFADIDYRRDQALNPAMATRPFAQIWTASTMGTVESIALNQTVEKGREAAESGKDTGIAYFEWSADDADDPADPEVWATCMPALGRTIDEAVVQHAYDSLPIDEFRRAYLNIQTAADTTVIPLPAWRAVCDPSVEAEGQVFALDCNPERSAAGIVAVGAGPVVEVVEYRPGVGWLVDRVCELRDKYRVQFAVDKNGPAAAFIDELKRRRVRLIELGGPDMAHAAELFFDRVLANAVQVRQNSDLDAAVAGAAKRSTSDAWTWGRKSSKFDISLLVAASAGVWALERAGKGKVISMADVLAKAEAEEAG